MALPAEIDFGKKQNFATHGYIRVRDAFLTNLVELFFKLVGIAFNTKMLTGDIIYTSLVHICGAEEPTASIR